MCASTWIGWLVVIIGLGLFRPARLRAHQPTIDRRGFVVGGMVIILVGFSSYMLRLWGRLRWICDDCDYRWRNC